MEENWNYLPVNDVANNDQNIIANSIKARYFEIQVEGHTLIFFQQNFENFAKFLFERFCINGND